MLKTPAGIKAIRRNLSELFLEALFLCARSYVDTEHCVCSYVRFKMKRCHWVENKRGAIAPSRSDMIGKPNKIKNILRNSSFCAIAYTCG